MRLRACTSSGLFLLAACRSPEPTQSRQAQPPSSAAAASASSASATAPAPAPGIPKERVEAAVARWLRAQEESTFDAYAALYAPLFSGVKRAGPRTTRLDRKGWLADRQEMFRKDTTIKVSDIRVFTGERTAFATFTQDWSTARFHDVGTKRLDFALQASELLITREEMLFSVASEAAGSKLPAPEQMALVWPLGKRLGVVLKRGRIATEGKAKRIPQPSEWEYLAEKAPAEAALEPFAAWRERALDLYDAKGVACHAKVQSFRVIGGYTASIDEPADDVWQVLGDTYLMAMVEPDSAKCQPLWARAAELPKPTLLIREALTGAKAKAAAEALDRTTVSVALQASYFEFREQRRAASADAGTEPGEVWPAHWGALEPRDWSATAFTDRASNVTYTVAERRAGQGCGEFGSYALGFFKNAEPRWLDLTGDGSPESSFPERPLFGMGPSTAVRLEDGRLFMLGPNVIYADAGFGFVPLLTIGPQRLTCAC